MFVATTDGIYKDNIGWRAISMVEIVLTSTSRILQTGGLYALLSLIAEVAASAGVWRGTPTDWSGPPLQFWAFEAVRLQYWIVAMLITAGALSLTWLAIAQIVSERVVLAAAMGLMLLAEIGTSIWFWNHLTVNETLYLGWPKATYLRDHLLCWAVTVLLAAALRRLLTRGRPAMSPS
jgi:hypothetical protein